MKMNFKFKYVLLIATFTIFISCGETKTVMPPNCDEGVENSILEKCTDLNKTCIVTNQVAECTECFVGYKVSGDSCVKIKGCSDLNCDEQNKYCEHIDTEDDAECVDCKEGFKLVGENCESVITCDILNCNSQNKKCVEAGKHSDAECTDCLDLFKEVDNSCIAVIECSNLNCESEHKACLHNNLNDDAECSSNCLSGFHKNEANICVETLGCDALNCFLSNQVCLPSTPLKNASCGRCLGGFEKDENETCVAMEYTTCDEYPAFGSIATECNEEHRNCIERTLDINSVCGECVAGYELVNNRCVLPTECSMLNCEASHKICEKVFTSENWKCGECKQGFSLDSETNSCVCNIGTILNRDTNLCEALKTCSQVTCSESEKCIEGNTNYHAYCSKCEAGEAWDGVSCKSCFECNGIGETGKVYPITSIQKHCVCETKENYFYSRSSLSTKSCDEDRDGWITEEARVVIDAPQNSADKINAKCNIRYIDKFILKNENEQKRTILISELTKTQYLSIPLYEIESRDSQEKLEIDYVYGTATFFAPAYGKGIANTDTFYFNTSQLNMLTKALPAGSSVNKANQADYNANGIPDIDEKPWNTTVPSSINEVFMKFSYYIELNRGWYQKESDEVYGSYVISEKKRENNAPIGMSVELVNPDSNNYWQECYRKRDSKFNKPSGTGLDFAEFHYGSCTLGDINSWCGMNHHSQFKPFKIVSNENLDPLNPQYITIDELKKNYIVNVCYSYNGEFNIIGDGEYNPTAPILGCSAVEAQDLHTGLQTGTLVWAISKYEEYNNVNNYYNRGCINECTDMGILPEDDRCIGGTKCSTAPGDYGKLICSEGIVMSKIIPASVIFKMGDDSSNYYSKFSQSYEISTKEIDQTMFEIVMKYNPSYYSCGRSSCPVESLTWYDAIAFTNRYTELLYGSSNYNCYDITITECVDGNILSNEELNNYDKKYCQKRNGIKSATINYVSHLNCVGYRLPTEAEWEFAAKGMDYISGYYTPFNSDEYEFLSDIAWFTETEATRTMPTGLKQPNKYLLFDMLGNVEEWVHDSYDVYPTNSTQGNPNIDYVNDVENIELNKSIRGGSFNSDAESCKNMARAFATSETKSSSLGFRIARSYIIQECRMYLESSNINTNRLNVTGNGKYKSEYTEVTAINDETGLEETNYIYVENFYDNFDSLSMLITTNYENKEAFIYDKTPVKNNFLKKSIKMYTAGVLYNSYTFSKDVNNIVITKDGSNNFNMTYPVIDGDGTMETENCIGITLNVDYTVLTQKITLNYETSEQRVQGADYNPNLDTCKSKASEIYNNKIDGNGNIIDLEWIDIKVNVQNSIYDGYKNVCK